jgi:hypothetical protein
MVANVFISPFFTIVLYCDNVQLILRTILSILAQRFPLWELILVENQQQCARKFFDSIVPSYRRFKDERYVFPFAIANTSISISQVRQEVLQVAHGIWMIEMNAGDGFSSPESLTNFLKHVKTNTKSKKFRLKDGMTATSGRYEMKFIYDSKRSLRQLGRNIVED